MPAARPATRVRCIVPFCGRRAPGEDRDESFCDLHWRGAAGPLRDRYTAAWIEATRFEAIGDLDPDVFARATDAWDALKAHVIGSRRS
jgi:hypothetical protein